MKKIAFLGDSIRMGYAARTMELLGDGYEYFQPTDNCRFATYTKRLVWDHRAKLEGSEVIHWNNGLWDICNLWGDGCFTPLDEYIREMEGLARRLLPMLPCNIAENSYCCQPFSGIRLFILILL